MTSITAIKPTAQDPARYTIRAGGKVVATLAESSVKRLGLSVGAAWTDALAAEVREAAARDKALRDAMRSVGRRAQSRGMLAERLQRRGYDADDVGRVLDQLEARGLIDDEAFGRLVVRAELHRKAAGERLLRHKLMQKKVPRELIDGVLAEELAGRDAVAEARALAERRLATRALQRLDAPARQRRAWSLLARRGFDVETIKAALDGLFEQGP